MNLRHLERIRTIRKDIKESQDRVVDLNLIHITPQRILKSELIDENTFEKATSVKSVEYSMSIGWKIALIFFGLIFTFLILFNIPFDGEGIGISFISLIILFNLFIVWNVFFRKTSIKINSKGIFYGRSKEISWGEVLYVYFEYDTSNQQNHLLVHKKTGENVKILINDFLKSKVEMGSVIWAYMNEYGLIIELDD